MTESPCVFITGGGARVGRALALHLAAKGWNVALHYHRSEAQAVATGREIEALGRRCHLLRGDLENAAGLSGLMEEARAALGGVHALINNAAMFEKDTPRTLSAESFDAHIHTNLRAPLLLSRAFAQNFVPDPAAQVGQIVHLLDGMQGWSISPQFFSYAVSKLALTEALALQASMFAPGIRVNAIALGATLPGKQDDASTFAKLAATVPLQRNSSPEEVCRALDFIFDSPSLTGQIIALNSGLHLKSLAMFSS